MRTLTRLGIFAAATTLVAFSEATFAVDTADANPGSTGATTVLLNGSLRACDGSQFNTAPQTLAVLMGTGEARIHTSGSTVVAEVHLLDAAQPGTHFDAGLIQEPRPASATCGPGDPGTTFSGFVTDATGQGNVTIAAPLRQGTTGVWVIVERPNGHSQDPGEVYTSEYVAPV